MGLIIRDHSDKNRASGASTGEPAGSSSVAMLTDETLAREPAGSVRPASAPTVVAGPPLGSIDMDKLEERELPHLTSARENRLQVAITRSVLADIRAHGKSQPEVEVCGVLVGNVYRDQSGPFLHIEANIRGNNAAGKAAQVTFTAETWKHIQDVMEEQYPDDRIVGWYHTHPGFGIFLSDMDLFIHNNFFSEPWQVAFVYDPKSNEQGLFLRRGGQTIREKFLLDDEGAPAGGGEASMIGTSAQMVAPGTISELSDRVQRLERKQRWQSPTFWLMVLLIAVWPVAVMIFFPAVVQHLPPSMQRMIGEPAAGTSTGGTSTGLIAPLPAPLAPTDPTRIVDGQLFNLRTQISIYKRQHNGVAPSRANFWKQLTQYTAVTGETAPKKDDLHQINPYYQAPAVNALTGSDVVGSYEGDANTGWAYDETTGQLRAMKSKSAHDVLD